MRERGRERGAERKKSRPPRRSPSPRRSISLSVFRVLDANLNRAREGLRVLEDTARFVWRRENLFRVFRAARHDLDKATRAAYPRLLAARESLHDAGRRMAEAGSRTWPGLAAANFRRAQEALRVLEEYGKVFSRGAAPLFKGLRFRLYSLEKKVMKRV